MANPMMANEGGVRGVAEIAAEIRALTDELMQVSQSEDQPEDVQAPVAEGMPQGEMPQGGMPASLAKALGR